MIEPVTVYAVVSTCMKDTEDTAPGPNRVVQFVSMNRYRAAEYMLDRKDLKDPAVVPCKLVPDEGQSESRPF